MDGERTEKSYWRAKKGEEGEKKKTQIKVEGLCWIGLEEYGCEQIENESLGQNRMDICREGRQGQT